MLLQVNAVGTRQSPGGITTSPDNISQNFSGPRSWCVILEFLHFWTFLQAALTVLASRGDLRAEIRRRRTNSWRSVTWPRPVWPELTYVSRLPSGELAGFGQIWLKGWPIFG